MRPSHVTIYGNDHSPWVQAVLLGLHEAEIPWTLVTAPPPRVFAEAGVLMPAVRFDEGPWRYDSGAILADLGYGNQLLDVRFPFPMIISASAYVDKYGPAERFNILSFAHRVAPPVHFVFGSIEIRSTMFAGLPDLVRQARDRRPTEVSVVEGADHNYRNREAQLGQAVIQWLEGWD